MRTAVRSGEAIALAAALTAGLGACAQEQAPLPPASRPTMAPEQTTGEACAASTAEVDSLVSELQQSIGRAGEAVASGETPDFGGLVDRFQNSLGRLAAEVSNTEVLAALDELRSELDGFDGIAPPDSILGMPDYLGSLGGQLGELQEAGRRLQTLCDAG